MEKFAAKVPHDCMRLQLIFHVKIADDASDHDITNDKKGPTVVFKPEMEEWLSSCVGNWKVLCNTWEIEFEKEEDFVRYQLFWK